MNILQMIWSALTVPNEELIKILAIPLTYLDAYIGMLFFTTVLDIKASNKRKVIYVITYATIGIIASFFISTSYYLFFNIIVWPFIIFFVLKPTILKTILAEIITLVTTSTLDFILVQITQYLFNIPFDTFTTIPIYRITLALLIFLIIFILIKIINYFKVNIVILENMNIKSKVLLLINLLLLVLVLIMQFYLIAFYSNVFPFYILLFSTIALIAYFGVSLYSIINTSKLASTTIELENTQSELHTFKILHEQVRSFKHDFDNMVNSIGGYVVNEDLDGLKRYYSQLLEECNKTNNLYALSPEVINHPAIYHLLATKYYEADQQNVQINLHVFLDLNEIEKRMKIYDFTRILGILLDNAIEAAKECEKKIINVTFRKDNSNNMIVVIIQNTYANKDVDTEEIYQKGISSKKNHSGLGLWKVREILMHNNNLNLFTTKNNEFFTQQFEIYK